MAPLASNKLQRDPRHRKPLASNPSKSPSASMDQGSREKSSRQAGSLHRPQLPPILTSQDSTDKNVTKRKMQLSSKPLPRVPLSPTGTFIETNIPERAAPRLLEQSDKPRAPPRPRARTHEAKPDLFNKRDLPTKHRAAVVMDGTMHLSKPLPALFKPIAPGQPLIKLSDHSGGVSPSEWKKAQHKLTPDTHYYRMAVEAIETKMRDQLEIRHRGDEIARLMEESRETILRLQEERTRAVQTADNVAKGAIDKAVREAKKAQEAQTKRASVLEQRTQQLERELSELKSEHEAKNLKYQAAVVQRDNKILVLETENLRLRELIPHASLIQPRLLAPNKPTLEQSSSSAAKLDASQRELEKYRAANYQLNATVDRLVKRDEDRLAQIAELTAQDKLQAAKMAEMGDVLNQTMAEVDEMMDMQKQMVSEQQLNLVTQERNNAAATAKQFQLSYDKLAAERDNLLRELERERAAKAPARASTASVQQRPALAIPVPTVQLTSASPVSPSPPLSCEFAPFHLPRLPTISRRQLSATDNSRHVSNRDSLETLPDFSRMRNSRTSSLFLPSSPSLRSRPSIETLPDFDNMENADASRPTSELFMFEPQGAVLPYADFTPVDPADQFTNDIMGHFEQDSEA